MPINRLLIAAGLLALAGCASNSVESGSAGIATPSNVARIVEGESNAFDVTRLVGRPDPANIRPLEGREGWEVWTYNHSRSNGSVGPLGYGARAKVEIWALTIVLDDQGRVAAVAYANAEDDSGLKRSPLDDNPFKNEG